MVEAVNTGQIAMQQWAVKKEEEEKKAVEKARKVAEEKASEPPAAAEKQGEPGAAENRGEKPEGETSLVEVDVIGNTINADSISRKEDFSRRARQRIQKLAPK